jgi:transitional endoplasmic reticulum ATPase
LADKTNGFTGADINLLITDAALLALKENKYKLTKVKEEHIDRVYKKMRPNIAIDNNQIYNSFKSDTAVAKYVQ